MYNTCVVYVQEYNILYLYPIYCVGMLFDEALLEGLQKEKGFGQVYMCLLYMSV